MQSIIKLTVSGNTSGATYMGELDLYGKEEINLVYSIKDFRDIASTTSSYSQTFAVPGTKNNNLIFEHLFLVGADGKFDPRKKANCWMTVDSLPVMEGYLQITSIDVADRDKPVYNITIFSATKGFNSKIKGKYLTDYNWSGLNHTFSFANVESSWTGSSSTHGYYYSLKDYGYDYVLKDMKPVVNSIKPTGVPLSNMLPDIYNKYIIDNIFATEGYSYQSTLLTSTTFTETIIPYSRDPETIMGTDYVTGRTFIANNNSSSSITLNQCYISPYWIQPYTYDYEYRIRANNVQSGSVASTQYTLSGGGDYYTVDVPGAYAFSFNVEYIYNLLPNQIRGQIGCRFYRSGFNNGTMPFWEELSLSEPGGLGYQSFTTPMCDSLKGPYTYGGQTFKPFQAGERVWASLFFRVNLGYIPPTMTNIPFQITGSGITWKSIPSGKPVPGSTINFNNVIPEKVLVTDYLKSVFNMFNCYLEPSKTVPNRFVIEPFEEFYAQGTNLNWTSKLDRSQKITETLISEELAKQYTFTFKEDKDFLNENYKNTTKRVYGDYTADLDNDFVTKEDKVEIIFSPTPVDNVIGSNQFVIPKIGKYDSNNKFGKTNFNIRFLRKNPNPRRLPSGETWGFTGTTYNYYPYAGHLDDPFSGTTDYNFGAVPYVYYPWSAVTNAAITQNNLFNNYWNKYITEITDKEAKLIKCFIKLTPADIFKFKFQDKVYIEGISSEVGHMYRVNSIVYSPNSGKPAEVELIKELNRYVSKRPSKWGGVSVLNQVDKGNIALRIGGSQLTKPNVISVGADNYITSDNAFVVGGSNVISDSSDGTVVVGVANTIKSSNLGVTVFGSGNTVESTAIDSYIKGNSNTISTGTTKAHIIGNSNTSIMAENVKIDGNNNSINVTGSSVAPSKDVTLIGDGNITYGSSTGLTVNGYLNTIDVKNLYTNVNGVGNVVGYATGSTIDGSGNTIISSDNSTVRGNFNSVDAKNTAIFGHSNNLSYGFVTGVTVFGDSNTVQSQYSNGFIAGNSNSIQGIGSGNTVFGNNNSIGNNSSNAFVYGNSNNIDSFLDHKYSAIFGSGNTLASPYSLLLGYNNFSSGGQNLFIKGNSNTITNLQSPTIAGNNNLAYDSDLCNINGNNNTLAYSTATTIFGTSNIVLSASSSQIIGSGNTIRYANEAIVQGNNNQIYSGASNVKVYGKNNIVHSGATGVHIVGDNNIVQSGVTNVSIMSLNGITATLSNTVHANNVYVYDTLNMQTTSNARQAGGTAAVASAAFGTASTASGNYSFSVNNNTTASGASSFASGIYSTAVGEGSSAFGKSTQASGYTSIAYGEDSTTSKNYGFAGGWGAKATRYAEFARSSNGGYGQYGSVMFFGTSSSSAMTEIFLDGSIGPTPERFVLEDNTTYYMKIRGTGADYNITSSGMSISWEGSALIKNTAGTVAMVQTPSLVRTYTDTAVQYGVVSVTADTTNKSFKVEVGSTSTPPMIWTVLVEYVKCKHNPL